MDDLERCVVYQLSNGYSVVILNEGEHLVTVFYVQDRTIGKIGNKYFKHLISGQQMFHAPIKLTPAVRILYG